LKHFAVGHRLNRVRGKYIYQNIGQWRRGFGLKVGGTLNGNTGPGTDQHGKEKCQANCGWR